MFETVVTARLANEIETIQIELAEEAAAETEKFKTDMVEKIDSYLNYVAENWMKENELAIERGLRTEITEDFIKSLKTVFQEHYIEVPEEKYDVLDEMQNEIEEISRVNSTNRLKLLLNSKVKTKQCCDRKHRRGV